MKPHFPSTLIKRLVLGSGTLCLAATGSACFERQATIDPSILQLQERIILLELKIKEAESKISALQQDTPNSGHTAATDAEAFKDQQVAGTPDQPQAATGHLATNESTPEQATEADNEITQTASTETPEIGTMDTQDILAENSHEHAPEKDAHTPDTDDKPAPLVEMGVYDVDSKYQEAYSHYNNRRYSEAKAIYQNIAENHGDHKLAPNAYYWWGEVEYDRGNYNQAVLAFQRLLDRFPKSHKVPDALLKLGKSREKLGQISEAREDYQRVIDRYPDSRAATIAESWL